jgi:hypothetical protein
MPIFKKTKVDLLKLKVITYKKSIKYFYAPDILSVILLIEQLKIIIEPIRNKIK